MTFSQEKHIPSQSSQTLFHITEENEAGLKEKEKEESDVYICLSWKVTYISCNTQYQPVEYSYYPHFTDEESQA